MCSGERRAFDIAARIAHNRVRRVAISAPRIVNDGPAVRHSSLRMIVHHKKATCRFAPLRPA
ncbi:hypothetical protein CFB89_18225 [Burkholderia sp. AU16741]|nr:hypothetical protein CFB89_18225 [Burkholderia sp. AU16741]